MITKLVDSLQAYFESKQEEHAAKGKQQHDKDK
jgi:hypothetical protein